MLNTIKGRFLSATKSVSVTKSEEPATNGSIVSPDIVNAGGDILKHFQDQWVELHVQNEDNVKKVQKIAKCIADIHDRTNKRKKDFSLLNDWVASLPYLSENLIACSDYLSNVCSMCGDIEKELCKLEVLIKDTELKAAKREEENKQQSETLGTKKHTETNSLEDASIQQRLASVSLQDRQKIYQDAFHTDLENYKRSGIVPGTRNPEGEGVSLEDIQIDCSTQELEEFLDST